MIIDQKTLIKKWWNDHSQDYKDDFKKEYQGVDILNLRDEEFLRYLEELDKVFAKKAYFAQKRGDSLFSDLIFNENLKNKNVLEIGCGLGSHSQVLAEKNCNLTAIDLTEKSVEITKRRLVLKGYDANILQADCEDLPFDDGYFDYIWSWGVIHHTPNTKKAAQEITRVLKKNGRLGIMIYNNNSLYKFLNVYFRYGILNLKFFKGYSKQDLKNMYTDGKEIGGAPLSKYYSKKDLLNLFCDLKVINLKCFEQKNFLTFWVPRRFKSKVENIIPDKFYSYIFKNIGFLLFANFVK